jgi:hypothetical protein
MDFRLDVLESGCGSEYEKFRTAAEAAKTAYVEALQVGDTPLELKEVLKTEWETASKRADLALETLHAAKRRLLTPRGKIPTTDSDPEVELDAIDKELEVLGKRKRKDLTKLVRQVETPFGGWFDKSGKYHVTHAESAAFLSRLLEKTWKAMDFVQGSDFWKAISTYAEGNTAFQSSVYEVKDALHDVIDELDWEGFLLRIKHEEGYPVFKALKEGTGFHTESAERQKRLNQARKTAKASEASKNRGKSSFSKPSARPYNGTPQQSFRPAHSRDSSASTQSYQAPTPSGPPKAHCFKCNRAGHYARDCKQS